MYKLIVALVVLGSSATAQTDIATLSEKDQELHRWGFCRAIDEYAFNIDSDLDFDSPEKLERHEISAIDELLLRNDRSREENDPKQTYKKARFDTDALLLSEQLDVDQSTLDSCNADMKKILAKTYVPHFKYLGD
jgi:hypothetical protein